MKSPFRHLALLLLPLHACQDPTYVTVHVTTDVPCERLQGVTLTLGSLGPLETKVATTRTADCNGGEIGTLSVVPSADEDGEFGIRVVMGIGRDVESCVAPDYGDGCVVARRGLRFLPNESLTLPIVMRQVCNGIPCGPYDTCVKGVCVPAKVDANACKGPQGCDEDVLAANAIADGGVDGPPADAGDGGEEQVGVEPVTTLQDYCGTTDAVDLSMVWPMRGGCPTLANRSRYPGPADKPVLTQFEPSAWTGIAIDDADQAWGNRGGGLTRISLTTGSPISLGKPANSGSGCALSSILRVCVGSDQVTDFGTTGALNRQRPVILDGGTQNLSPDGWNLGPANNVFVYTLLTNSLVGMTPTATAFNTPLDGTDPGPPAMSKDGTTIYVATENSLTAYDTADGTERWKRSIVTVGVVAVGPTGLIHTVMVPPDAGASRFLRTYDSAGTMAGNDVALSNGGSIPWQLAVGRDTAQKERVIVLRNQSIDGINAVDRNIAWSQPAPYNARMTWSFDGSVYLAGQNEMRAIKAEDGFIRWSVTDSSLSNQVNDVVIGKNRVLWIADSALRRAAAP